MTIQCPHCSTRYELPSRLLGPGGSEVRCPRCRRKFMVDADGAVIGAPAAGGTAAAAAPPSPAPEPRDPAAPPPAREAPAPTPATVATAVLDDLAARSGAELAAANAHGRLFAEFGPALIAAYDEYRRRVGPGADPGPFRDAMRQRWDIELTPRWGEDR
jgi:predicted Zn finger-like uncharacterized protein